MCVASQHRTWWTVVSVDFISFSVDKARFAMSIDFSLPLKGSTKCVRCIFKRNITFHFSTHRCLARVVRLFIQWKTTRRVLHFSYQFRCAVCRNGTKNTRTHVTVAYAVIQFARTNSNDFDGVTVPLNSTNRNSRQICVEKIRKIEKREIVCENSSNESNLMSRRSDIDSIAHPEFSIVCNSFFNEFFFSLFFCQM